MQGAFLKLPFKRAFSTYETLIAVSFPAKVLIFFKYHAMDGL
jgi:hypothetical protein